MDEVIVGVTSNINEQCQDFSIEENREDFQSFQLCLSIQCFTTVLHYRD